MKNNKKHQKMTESHKGIVNILNLLSNSQQSYKHNLQNKLCLVLKYSIALNHYLANLMSQRYSMKTLVVGRKKNSLCSNPSVNKEI